MYVKQEITLLNIKSTLQKDILHIGNRLIIRTFQNNQAVIHLYG